MSPRRRVLKVVFSALLLFVLASIGPAHAIELEKKSICAWDPVGLNGPVIRFFAGLVPEAIKWGLDVEFIPFEDEQLAVQSLTDQKCQAAIVTAILSRDFVPFAGTLDAIGGITSEKKLRQALATIASPKATELMSLDGYEVTASLPVGSMFAFVKDRRIRGIDDFRGKRIAVLNNDIQAKTFAELSNAIPVDETLSTFSDSFNNGRVDIVFMPALAYDTFELQKGLGKTGGILDLRMFYGMLQMVSRKSDFSEDFGVKMRRYMLGRLNDMLSMIENAENTIPEYYWIHTTESTKEELKEFYKDIRLALKVQNKFDEKALSLLWRIRCKNSPNETECRMPDQ